MKPTKQHVVGGAVVAVFMAVVLILPSCGQKFQEPFKDAPQDGHHDNSPGKVIEMPDGFSNLATKCVAGVRYAVTYHGDRAYGAVSMLGGDNGCPK